MTSSGLVTASNGIVSGANIVSDTDSTDDLGTTGVRWANLWVDDITATTSVIAGTMTVAAGSITDSSGAIDFVNENLTTLGDISTQGLVVGSATQHAIAGTTPEVQVLGTGVGDSTIVIGRWGATVGAPQLRLYKSRNATIGSLTAITTGDLLGEITAYGDDGTDADTESAQIQFASEGTIGTGRVPSKIVFLTGTDTSSTSLQIALTLNSGQNATFAKSILMPVPNTVAGTGLMVTTNDDSVQEIMRDSSSARFKEDIEDAVVDVRAVLAINSKRYGRKGAVGSYLGFIVEDFHDAGFGDILAYDAKGPAGFLEFGRGVTALHHTVLQSHDERIAALEAELAELKAA
jgi:hypothetical protein